MTIQELKKYICHNDKIPFILDTLKCTEIRYHPSKNYYSCCNADGGDNPTAVNVYNTETLTVVDYTRDLSSLSRYPDLITLIQYYQKSDFRQAIVWLHQVLNLPLTAPSNPETTNEDPLSIFKSLRRYKKNSIEYRILNENILLDFYPYVHKDFAKEGILKSTIKKFNLGYSYACQRTIIPIRYWQNGDLIGIRGRTSIPNYEMFDIPKYFPIKTYQKSINVYGLWEQYQDIINAGSVVIFEGEKSTLKLDSLQPAVLSLSGRHWYGVSLSGHDLSEEQLKILCGLNLQEYIIAFDKDIPETKIWETCEKFYHFRNVSYIFDNESLLKDKDSPIDQGIKTFLNLINHRIPYDANHHEKYMAYLSDLKRKMRG